MCFLSGAGARAHAVSAAHRDFFYVKSLERVKGIEPSYSAWEAKRVQICKLFILGERE